MRLLALLGALFTLGWGLASAQSLAEVAEKEKDRREQAQSGESAPVIDNDELSRARGDGLSVMGANAANAAGESASSEGAQEDSPSRNANLSEAEVRDYRETWARVWSERLAAAELELELAKEAVFQCHSAAHYVYVPLAVDCNGVFERRAIADYRLKEIRQTRFNWELLLPDPPESKRPPPQP